MSFFDDAVSAAKIVGKNVGKRAEEIVVISKKKLESIELENKLSALYENLGKYYYIENEGTAEDLAEDIEEPFQMMDDIKRVSMRLDELKTEIENLSKK